MAGDFGGCGIAGGTSPWPALAEPRWLACKYTDRAARRRTSSWCSTICATPLAARCRQLVEGTSTSINFQALRTRFPAFTLTYNRNDGALAMTPLAGFGGILTGECRRSPPPPGVPSPG